MLFNLITRQPLNVDLSVFQDPRDPIVKEDTASIRRAKTAQLVERFAVIWPECYKSPMDGLKAIAAIYGDDGVAVMAIWQLLANEYGPATIDRTFEKFLEDRK